MKENKVKKSKVKKRKKWLVVCIIILLVLLAAASYIYYLAIYRGKHEPKAAEVKTSTDAVYTEEKITKKLAGFEGLKSLGYENLSQENAIVVPGLKSTRTLSSNDASEIDVCTSMTPQGVCIAEDYLLISAYCHSKTHNSVIYVLDKNTHAFLKEIVLQGRPHVGSLAYDTKNKNIWVACYSKGIAYADAFSLDALEAYNLDEETKPLKFQQKYPVYTIPRASFLYYEEGGLYIGYFSTGKDDLRTIQKFLIEEDGTLALSENPSYGKDEVSGKHKEIIMPADTATIDSDCQGMAFYKDLIFLSQSVGIKKSKIQVFINEIRPDEKVMELKNEQALAELVLPQQLEQVYVNEDKLYLLFESGAYAYRDWPGTSMDRVLTIDISDLQ